MRQYFYDTAFNQVIVIYSNLKKQAIRFSNKRYILTDKNSDIWLKSYYSYLGIRDQRFHEICKNQFRKFILEKITPKYWDFDEKSVMYPRDFWDISQ